MPSLTTSPWQAAVDRLGSKSPVGAKLNSAEWAKMPLALREGSLFSARVENARVVSAMKDKLTQAAQQIRTEGTLMDRSRFVADMRSMLGAAPGDSGDLTDITSRRRLELIWNFQQQDAHAFAAREANLDPDVLDAYPAQRLVRTESRRVPRDWFVRWGQAGASVGWQGASQKEMVALVTSPIWQKLSRFGKPHPPFDYGSGMGLDSVDRDEAEALGLLPKNEPPAQRLQRLRGDAAAARQRYQDGLQASVRDLDEQALAWLKQSLGDQIEISGGSVRWKGGPATTPTPAPAPTPTPATLPETQRVAEAVAKAKTREEAHAIVALPAAERGSLTLNPTAATKKQAGQAHEFIHSVLHRDVAPSASAKLRVARGKRPRGFYDPATATAVVRKGAVENTVHELAHHIECSDPEILAECRAFLQSRLKPGETPRSLRTLTGVRRYRPDERAIEDEWVARGNSVYCGKIYGASADSAPYTEILTMGLERMYSDPVKFARDDPDYFQFILKVLRPTPQP